MKNKQWVLLGVLLLLGLVALYRYTGRGGQSSSAAYAPTASEGLASPERPVSSDGFREAVATSAEGSSDLHRPEAPNPSPPTLGKITGLVIDGFRRGVAQGVVELNPDRGKTRSTALGPDGSFEFLAPAGSYTVELQAKSLPKGVLPPWNQTQSCDLYKQDPAFSSGYYATEVKIPKSGGEFSVQLRVFQQAIVAGYVVGPDGEPVEGASVRVQICTPHAPTGIEVTTDTDAQGRYEMIGVYPGKYRTEVRLIHTISPSYHDASLPLPVRVDVEEGGVYEVPALRVGAGLKVIRGSVVNQDGAPFVGVYVLCYLTGPVEEGVTPYDMGSMVARTRTDSEGWYELLGLPAVRVKVSPAADYEPNAPLGKQRAAFWIPPIEVDLARSETIVVLPPQQVDESRPFFFKGTIELDPSWAKANKVEVDLLDVWVDLLDPSETLPPAIRRPAFQKEQLRVDDETGGFQWACETPHLPVRITIGSNLGSSSATELVLYPQPNRSEEQTVRLPK